jgi:hypothetical protein
VALDGMLPHEQHTVMRFRGHIVICRYEPSRQVQIAISDPRAGVTTALDLLSYSPSFVDCFEHKSLELSRLRLAQTVACRVRQCVDNISRRESIKQDSYTSV